MGFLLPSVMVTTMTKSKKKGKKKATKRKRRGILPQTVTVSVSTTFVVKDMIEDIIEEQYPYWGDDIVNHMNDVLIDEILDWCLHQAQETLQEKVEDYRKLVLTDEHGQLIKVS